MKLKEKDKRPRYQYEPGDIVELHGSVKEISGRKGLVLQTESSFRGEGYQTCLCVFAGRDVDLYRAARRFISYKLTKEDLSFGVSVSNTKLIYKEKCPREWLKSITCKEIRTMRFIKILEED